ncbi:hypothetical protein CKJ56_11560 [Mycobacterium intracellulare subsp. chimaera]|nr:hypothetical protein CKJ58_12575 [Mycobacterium intracellulare subsp. chimaera]ELR85168.1 hypothetical protein W7U_08065 [Mycobacterium sp. H4Y]PBA63424.1 hypothetical protein CKJ56_11560 [Mycobacterium intracellulare subsp. chimaera]
MHMAATPFPYVASEPTTDPAELLREEQIRTRHLRQLLAEADATIAAREATITELTQELAAIGL